MTRKLVDSKKSNVPKRHAGKPTDHVPEAFKRILCNHSKWPYLQAKDYSEDARKYWRFRDDQPIDTSLLAKIFHFVKNGKRKRDRREKKDESLQAQTQQAQE